MKIKLTEIEKVRVNINGKLQTLIPSVDYPSVDSIVKIYVNRKWVDTFKLFLNDMCDYVVQFWTIDEIRENLLTKPKWLFRGILAIYEYQTEDEKNRRDTNEYNDVGFNKFDADFLSGMAKRLLEDQQLSEKQVEVSKKKMIKYAGQLLKIANGKL